jgi:U3 small nucleolar RNA-associated protein 6
MAAASDKARFFLEQSVPELKELERKKIFLPEEISKIARQRSDFEHKINARGSTASDYVRYAQFEMNVDALRKKRVKRLGVKGTTQTGPRRIFFVFDRGTKKHPGDIGIWLEYIDYAKKQQAHKKLSSIFTNVLRLHPTRPELWINAAQFAMEENGDMTEARGYMQRGLRFNKNKRSLWLQYLRLEMSYIAKIQARREILGLTIPQDEDHNSDAPIALTPEDVAPTTSTYQADTKALQVIAETPVRSGAIPVAIFEAATRNFDNDAELSREVLYLLGDYLHLRATSAVLRRLKEHVSDQDSRHWIAVACEVWLPVAGLDPSSAEFPSAFKSSLKTVLNYQKTGSHRPDFPVWVKRWLDTVLETEDLDPAIAKVTSSVAQSL